MKVLFVIILVILLVILMLYLSIIIKVKLNITYNEAIVLIKIVLFKFSKTIKIKYNFLKIIKKLLDKNENKIDLYKRNIRVRFKYLIRPFYIKDINFYSECYNNKLSVAIEFSVVNIITKGVY
ncbi:hypothetical protein JYG23_04960 [Sedimentibacter sp. zth1]|uniref:hypothetical protein n=1 Tax=Sedimentibacter sp. zth1 TaxID=2816908 RepID=UPI001A91E1E0|nr:hypothetical protein [Sedimentibacter sp. zth1]QSX06801.1 hypothetical protein JYG23_04960 [Sedimentibacter sp. zth1]